MLYLDLETFPIDRARMAPEPVCASYAPGPHVALIEDSASRIRSALEGSESIILANAAFDLAVLLTQSPTWARAIFHKFASGTIRDLLIDFKLHLYATQGYVAQEPSLALLCEKYKVPMAKDTSWRQNFAALKGVPVAQWPPEAREYAAQDAQALQLLDEAMPERPALSGMEARKAFALHLVACWGVHTDRARVEALEKRMERRLARFARHLKKAGLVRADGSRDTKKAKALMARSVLNPARTETGEISLDKYACEDSGVFLLQAYSEYVQAETLRSRIEDMKEGYEYPLQVRFNTMLETGRTSTSKPKLPLRGVQIQNFPQKAGARECLVARPGHGFVSCDLPTAELRSLAQTNIDLGFGSSMADQLNAGRDLHLWFAAQMLGLPYEEAVARKKDPAIVKARKQAKPCNFGFPGGMGIASFIRYAKRSYRVELSEQEAWRLKGMWLEAFPEMRKYFERAGRLLENRSSVTIQHIRSGRIRARCGYTQVCNSPFQELTGVATSEGLCRVQELAYVDESSPLWDTRVVMYVHDEIVSEVWLGGLTPAALALSRVMAEEFNKWHPDVPVLPCTGPSEDPRVIMPAAARHYSKEMKTVWDDGKLLCPEG